MTSKARILVCAKRNHLLAMAPALAVLAGCMTVPVQELTLKNDSGGSVVCKQVGAGLISSSVGKSNFDDCVAKAHADGYK